MGANAETAIIAVLAVVTVVCVVAVFFLVRWLKRVRTFWKLHLRGFSLSILVAPPPLCPSMHLSRTHTLHGPFSLLPAQCR